jgi:hypothetical protein
MQDLLPPGIPHVSPQVICYSSIHCQQMLDFFTASRVLYLPWLELCMTGTDNDIPPRPTSKREVELIWTRDDADGIDPFKLGSIANRTNTQDTIQGWISANYNSSDSIVADSDVVGSLLIERTHWKWKHEHTRKSATRVHRPLGQLAILEDIRQRHVWSKLNDEILVDFRVKLVETIQRDLRTQRTKVGNKWIGTKGVWRFPVVFPSSEALVREVDWDWRDLDQDQVMTTLRSQQVSRIEQLQDKRNIQRVIDVVQRSPCARFSEDKEHSGVMWHFVSRVLSDLISVRRFIHLLL